MEQSVNDSYKAASNGKYYYENQNHGPDYDNSKKKAKKWSLSGLFKRRRNKSSDTDSSSELDDKKRGGFLSKKANRKSSHKVVGKFETIIIPKEEKPLEEKCLAQINGIEVYDASPNVIKRKHNIELPNGVSQSYQEIVVRHEPLDVKGSSGSLDAASRRAEKSKIKARVEAMRDRLRDDSSSSEECGSSRNSNCSLQRLQAEQAKNGSWSRKTRAARTDRYIKRHYRDDDGSHCCNSNSDLRPSQTQTPIGSPKSRWVAKVVYQQSSDYPTRYTARTHSATSSPMSSPLTQPKNFQCSSLPSKSNPLAGRNENVLRLLESAINGDDKPISKASPPPPPPRNPNRKVVPPVNRPSSYAFDANARQREIAAYVTNNRSTGYGNGITSAINGQYKSNSEMELRPSEKKTTARQALGLNDHNSYPKNRKRYSADKNPRSRNPIQVVPKIVPDLNNQPRSPRDLNIHVNRNLFADEIKPKSPKRNVFNGGNLEDFGYTEAEQRNLSKANEIGIPVVNGTTAKYQSSAASAPISNQSKLDERRGRPLSVVSEKSDNEVLNDEPTKRNPRNLEEALVELEEIYNSLKLNDEDLLDRADRRDLQAALRMNPNYNRHSWNDNSDTSNLDYPDGRYDYSEVPIDRPRLPTSRRSAIPDAVADDMAHRKWNKKDHDVKSNPNVVSQSGSFLLMSPALSPPPLVDIPPPVVGFEKEPDVTLDDVVFRNYRHVNNTLKVLDPQPPFGIPVGPVSPAPNSDYLHATPSEKYRSTFNPSRTPDVVKDDLAFRNLRKDIQSPDTTKQYLPACKKRRAIRSLSANVVSLIGKQHYENEDEMKKTDRAASFTNLPDVFEEYGQKRSDNEDEETNSDQKVDKTLDLIADEAKVLSKVLRKKLRELEAIPLTNGFENKNVTNDKDVFTKRVAVHKPITLSQFKISEGVDEKNSRNSRSSENNSDWSQLKPTQRRENIPINGNRSKRGNDNVNCVDVVKDASNPLNTDNFNWNSVKIIDSQCQPKRAVLSEIQPEPTKEHPSSPESISYEITDLKSDKTENSSSGVSSTSNTPDSSRKCHLNRVYEPYIEETDNPATSQGDNSRAKEIFLDENVLPSFADASEQFSKELESSRKPSNGDLAAKKDFCSRIEITLSTPQPAGVDHYYRRWSSVETKDAAIMTEELNLNGCRDLENRVNAMNGDTQSRVIRYKEERRKQLAGQFANLSRNGNDSSSSSSALDGNLKRNSFHPLNSNVTKDDEMRKPKISNNYKNPNKFRYKQNPSEESTDSKSKSNGSITPDTSQTGSSKSNRDKSAKRKSYLNRSTNVEKTPSNFHNHHANYHSADEGSDRKWNGRNASPCSLPSSVVVSASPATPSSISSQKTSPSLNYRKCTTVPVNSPISSHSVSNGFAQCYETDDDRVNKGGLLVPEHRVRIADKEMLDKSKIPRRIASPSRFSPRCHIDTEHGNNCCDNMSSEFRLQELETITLENETTGSDACSLEDSLNNGHCSFSDFETRDHSLERHIVELPAEQGARRNSLLDIIQNFSDKNAQNTDVWKNGAEIELRRSVNSTAKHFPITQHHLCSSSPQNTSLEIIEEDITPKTSILKKKFDERSISLDSPKPSSILKKKSLEDINHGFQNIRAYGKQGILKKHSSLDESEVRRRSCSPDVDLGRHQEFKPILKIQRRSSLEELIRNRSPELHSILKRSKAPNDDASDSGSSPHSILKRKISVTNGPSSFSPDSLEMCGNDSFDDSTVKPILKNKNHSFESIALEKLCVETPRPILKKKHSVDTDPEDEKPKKPILKCSRRSLDEETESFLARQTFTGHVKLGWNVSQNVNSIKPILKKKNTSFRDSRSVKSDDDAAKDYYKDQSFVKRNSLPVSSHSPPRTSQVSKENSFSVAERVLNLENIHIEEKPDDIDSCSSKNMTSRNLRFSRNIERYKTQPITHQEIFSYQSAMEEKKLDEREQKTVAMERQISSVEKQEICQSNGLTQTEESSVEENKDVLDDKVVISNLKRSNSVSMKASLFSKWQNESNRVVDELKLRKKEDKTGAGRKLKIKCSDLASRFATQPITWEEVAEAKKQNQEARSKVQDVIRKEILENVPENEEDKDDPSLMPLSERVKLFTQKMEQQKSTVSKYPKRLGIRFNTQPVTTEELQIAKSTASRKIGENKDSDRDANSDGKNDVDILNAEISKVTTHRKESQSDSGNASLENVNDDKLLEIKTEDDDKLLDVKIEDDKLLEIKTEDDSINEDIELLFEKIYLENSSETGSQSEGDTSSSGGREIQRIIGNKYHIEKREQITEVSEMNVGAVMSGGTDMVDDGPMPVINGGSSIAQRLAALQRSGQLDWKKRVSRIAPENELPPVININETQELLKKELANGFRCRITTETYTEEKKDGSLAERLEKLETASQTWKKRVEPSDAVKFSVAGKMASTLSAVPLTLPITSPLSERKKRAPCPTRFRSFREKKEVRSTPISPEKSKTTTTVYNRSNSLPSDVNDTDEVGDSRNGNDVVVSVPQIFDEDFSTFFGNADLMSSSNDVVEFDTDFSDIKIERPKLISTHKKIRAQRKHATSGNPLKSLSTRIEVKNEYREVKTNIAEKELKRMNVEKLSKNSKLAVEVLAGLASKEDFAAVHLKKAGGPISAPLLPYKSLMLLHIKGRRHVQTRLVEPVVQSVNSGDSYVLVTPNEVYHWIGQFCNVIEKSRGAEIAQHIVTTHDLGCCSASQVQTIVEDVTKPNSKAAQNFWMLLGASAEEAVSVKAASTGHPDEDEVYESSLISTNMIFEVSGDELVPLENYWGNIPKIQMLDPNKVLVFDFGSELYVWMGKNVDLKERKSSVKLAKELWDNGYNYDECDLCPVNSAQTIGSREVDESKISKKSKERPEWCLIAKVTQHMETVLFREKFLDWPDFTRVIRAKGKDEDTEKQIDGSLDIRSLDPKELLEMKPTAPDLILEGSHLGRGIMYFDEERRKFCTVTTTDVRMWHIMEFDSEEVPKESLGQFYSTDSYVIKWIYSISYTGRELSGQPSKHTIMGRDRCVYFCWQGKNASLNEQGAAALLTVELDKEKGMQLRICQGYEPPAFYNLFGGRTVIYKDNNNDKKWKLFICRGEINSEAALLEVTCNIRQLRSRASFVLVNLHTGVIYVWHGCKVTKAASEACLHIVNNLKTNCPPELGIKDVKDIVNVKEGEEPKEFFNGLGNSGRKLYLSLLEDQEEYNVTPLLYNLSSNSGSFCATPIWSPGRHLDLVTAYPFLQEDLYLASQPALFLLDTGKELWLWQGWWPEREKILQEESTQGIDDVTQNSINFRGSATVRWQLERRAAMQTALDYWKLKYDNKPEKAFLVWAGLEPIQFTNLFPDWNDRDDVAEINILDGRKPGEILDVEQELARLTQSTYPIQQLLQRPLPDGVDPTKLELYLSPQHFKEILNVSKEEFSTLPSWKQTNLKKNAGLF